MGDPPYTKRKFKNLMRKMTMVKLALAYLKIVLRKKHLEQDQLKVKFGLHYKINRTHIASA
jgi:hypothetical protein